MNITEVREKCKMLVSKIPRDVLIVCILALASTFSFGLGYLAGLDVNEKRSGAGEATPPAEQIETSGQLVASKNGTKYYLPSCSGADRISEENKIWFATAEAAVAAGYSPAANCDGI